MCSLLHFPDKVVISYFRHPNVERNGGEGELHPKRKRSRGGNGTRSFEWNIASATRARQIGSAGQRQKKKQGKEKKEGVFAPPP